jgi:hypothetical protein
MVNSLKTETEMGRNIKMHFTEVGYESRVWVEMAVWGRDLVSAL